MKNSILKILSHFILIIFSLIIILPLLWILRNSFTDKQNTSAFIYIVRDPRNVVLSMSNHFGCSQKESLEFLNQVPKPYRHIIKTQKTFMECYFETKDTKDYFEKLIGDEKYNFSIMFV